MKKLAFTTAIALALATTAYAQGHHAGGGPGPGGGSGGAGPGFSATAPGGGGGTSPSVKGGPSGPSNFSNSMGPSKGQTGGLYNQGRPTMNTYKQGGADFDKGRNRMGDRDYDRHLGDRDQNRHLSDRDNRHLYNRADRDDFGRRGHEGTIGGDRDIGHHGVVRGNFFEHGRHFGFRRFWRGQWVFLNGWDDCTAYAWVHVAPGTWAWTPVNICVG